MTGGVNMFDCIDLLLYFFLGNVSMLALIVAYFDYKGYKIKRVKKAV